MSPLAGLETHSGLAVTGPHILRMGLVTKNAILLVDFTNVQLRGGSCATAADPDDHLCNFTFNDKVTATGNVPLLGPSATVSNFGGAQCPLCGCTP